jgi:hypothetical protein
VVVLYRRFGTNYRSQVKKSLDLLNLEDGTDMLSGNVGTRRCVISQKSAHLVVRSVARSKCSTCLKGWDSLLCAAVLFISVCKPRILPVTTTSFPQSLSLPVLSCLFSFNYCFLCYISPSFSLSLCFVVVVQYCKKRHTCGLYHLKP